MRTCIFILLLFKAVVSNGQSFNWQADLAPVTKSGFYNILLSPELVSRTKSLDLNDIRIYQGKTETPYLFRRKIDTPDHTLIPVPVVKTTAEKDKKQTVISITFNAAYQIDKLELEVQGFKFYRRNAYLASVNPDYNSRRKYSEPYVRLEDFVITSGKPSLVFLPGSSRYQNLTVIIENEDNPALIIKGIKAYQRNMYLTAYLEKEKHYVVKMGQADLESPRYDLSYFSDSISRTGPSIKVLNFQRTLPEPVVKLGVFSTKMWIWSALALLIALVAYLSFRMVKEIQQRKS
jgi:hypothetical protein